MAKIMPKRLARKEAHTIASAAIHNFIMAGMSCRYDEESATRIEANLISMMEHHDSLSASMDEVEEYVSR